MFSDHVVIVLSVLCLQCFRSLSLRLCRSFSLGLYLFDSVPHTILLLPILCDSVSLIMLLLLPVATANLFYAVRKCDGIMSMCTQTRCINANEMNCAIRYIRATAHNRVNGAIACLFWVCVSAYVREILCMNYCRNHVELACEKKGDFKNGCISISHGFYTAHTHTLTKKETFDRCIYRMMSIQLYQIYLFIYTHIHLKHSTTKCILFSMCTFFCSNLSRQSA